MGKSCAFELLKPQIMNFWTILKISMYEKCISSKNVTWCNKSCENNPKNESSIRLLCNAKIDLDEAHLVHSIVISSLLFLSKVHLNLRGTHFSPNFFKARPQEEAKEYLRGGRGDEVDAFLRWAAVNRRKKATTITTTTTFFCENKWNTHCAQRVTTIITLECAAAT